MAAMFKRIYYILCTYQPRWLPCQFVLRVSGDWLKPNNTLLLINYKQYNKIKQTLITISHCVMSCTRIIVYPDIADNMCTFKYWRLVAKASYNLSRNFSSWISGRCSFAIIKAKLMAKNARCIVIPHIRTYFVPSSLVEKFDTARTWA